MNSFAVALSFVLSQEGGYSNNPHDPGHATMHGITLQVYRDYYNDQSLTVTDLRSISNAEIGAIYKTNYYSRCHCEQLPAGVDLMVFDFAVNSGVNDSIRLLQQVVGVTQDGKIGPETLATIRKLSPTALVNELYLAQVAKYRTFSDFPTFGNGWLARAKRRKDAALAMIPV